MLKQPVARLQSISVSADYKILNGRLAMPIKPMKPMKRGSAPIQNTAS